MGKEEDSNPIESLVEGIVGLFTSDDGDVGVTRESNYEAIMGFRPEDGDMYVDVRDVESDYDIKYEQMHMDTDAMADQAYEEAVKSLSFSSLPTKSEYTDANWKKNEHGEVIRPSDPDVYGVPGKDYLPSMDDITNFLNGTNIPHWGSADSSAVALINEVPERGASTLNKLMRNDVNSLNEKDWETLKKVLPEDLYLSFTTTVLGEEQRNENQETYKELVKDPEGSKALFKEKFDIVKEKASKAFKDPTEDWVPLDTEGIINDMVTSITGAGEIQSRQAEGSASGSNRAFAMREANRMRQESLIQGASAGKRAGADLAALKLNEQQTLADLRTDYSDKLLTRDSEGRKFDHEESKENAANDLKARQIEIDAILKRYGIDADIHKTESEYGLGASTEESDQKGEAGEKKTKAAGDIGSFADDAVQGGATSDEKAKKNKKKGNDALHEFLENLEAYTFEYKEDVEGETSGKKLGVMTKDMKKSKIGKEMVKKKGKYERFDKNDALKAMMAAVADMHKRIKDLED